MTRGVTRGRFGEVLRAVAGPALIVAAVLVVLHDYAFVGEASLQTGDILRFFLPRHCFLGKSLAAGIMPAWNPYSMGGTPFLGDPLSGWMALIPMAANVTLSCDVAVRLVTVSHPILAGLGIYWFARSEGLSRPAATVGGLTLALGLSGGAMVQKLHFTAMLAWSAVLLACSSRVLGARGWPARLVWIAAAAIAWGQVAAAFLTTGLIIATVALGLYLAAKLLITVRGGGLSPRAALGVVALLAVAFVGVNLAFFVPTVGYLPRTTLGSGYDTLTELAAVVGEGARQTPSDEAGRAMLVSSPLRLAITPGGYFGGAALLLFFGGLFGRRARAVPIAFLALGGLFYLASTEPVAARLSPVLADLPFGNVYAHAPHRFIYGLLLAAPVLAAFGVDAWCRVRSSIERLMIVAPGVATWFVLPGLAGAPASSRLVPALSAALSLGVLLLALRWPPVLAALPLLLAIEMSGAAIAGQASDPDDALRGLGDESVWRLDPFQPLLEPNISIAGFLKDAPMFERVAEDGGQGRFLASRSSRNLPAAPVYGVESTDGYSSVQIRRYWIFVRAISGRLNYNISFFRRPDPAALEVLAVDHVLAGRNSEGAGLEPVLTYGRTWLYEVARPEPRARVVTDWDVVTSERAALERVVTSEGERPTILEADPDIPAGGGQGEASYMTLGTQGARIEVTASRPSLVLIRNVFDPGWRATVNGRTQRIMRADYLNQAIAVPEGENTIELRYEDPLVTIGLVGTFATLLALGGSAGILRRVRRRDPQADGATRTRKA